MAPRFPISPAELRANRFAVLATYRHLLRATRIAFQGTLSPLLQHTHDLLSRAVALTHINPTDDQETLQASRQFAGDSFRQNRLLDSGGSMAAQGVEHAQGVTKILRENVVQGKNVGGEQYKLNIHEHTQKLDNDTAGQLKGTTKSFKEVKEALF